MFALGAARRVYLATGATDLRRGYNGLYAQVKHTLGGDPLNGDVYVFCNRRRGRPKGSSFAFCHYAQQL